MKKLTKYNQMYHVFVVDAFSKANCSYFENSNCSVVSAGAGQMMSTTSNFLSLSSHTALNYKSLGARLAALHQESDYLSYER